MHEDSQQKRFEAARQRFLRCADNPRADRPLASWAVPTDRHLPSRLIHQSLRQILGTPFTMLQRTKGVGITRLDRVLAVVERAVEALQPIATAGADPTSELASITPESVDDRQWRMLTATIRAHGLDHYPLARFARSLLQLPHGLWHEPLSSFTHRFLSDLHRVPRCGPARVRYVREIVVELGNCLASVPIDTPYGVQILPAAIRDLARWMEQVLAADDLPGLDALRTRFVEPLLDQLEIDLGADVAQMVRRRLGADRPPETLDRIAADYGLTRERIRQLVLRSPEVLQVRWPEGRYLLDDFYEKFRDAPAAREQVRMVRRALDLLFNGSSPLAVSYAEVLAEWDALGLRKRTPMTAVQIRRWLASTFPHLPPQIGLRWIAQEARSFESQRYGTLYFSSDDLDALLLELYERGAPTALSALREFGEDEERNVRGRINRDMRILEDEHKRLVPAEACSFYREGGEWRVELLPARRGSAPRQRAIAIRGLAYLTVAGLVQAGIADATVWGVHRYANEMLGRMFAARLPDEVTPFILAGALVRLTGGLIRPMRRRRLRWDPADTGIPVRGKRGWVGLVLAEHGQPVTLEELMELLRSRYQDCAPYVISHLNLDAEEEGDAHCSGVWYPGVPYRIPPILVPADWELDTQRDNVSQGIQRLVPKILGMLHDKVIGRQDLRGAPWLLELVERQAFSGSLWQEARPVAVHGAAEE